MFPRSQSYYFDVITHIGPMETTEMKRPKKQITKSYQFETVNFRKTIQVQYCFEETLKE